MKSLAEFRAVYCLPLPDLLFRAAEVHRAHRPSGDIQRCALLSIKTGGCPEDCGYCSQSAHYQTPVAREPLLSVEEVKVRAREARDRGATRFCMGAAWRGPKDGPEFDAVLEMVREVRALDMEACVTLGMLTLDLAHRKRLGSRHTTTTSVPAVLSEIVTRTYTTARNTSARAAAGISVCCGGIGMGEAEDDRLMMLVELANLERPPRACRSIASCPRRARRWRWPPRWIRWNWCA